MTLCIIDADSLLFKVAATSKTEHEIRRKLKAQLSDIPKTCFASDTLIGVKGTEKNFRYSIYPYYKSNRPALDEDLKSKLNYAHQHVVDKHGAHMTAGPIETDDVVADWAMECIEDERPFVIAAIDKDLWNIPGPHYNYNKDTHDFVSLEKAQYNFTKQILTGDRVDGIPGVKGIGDKKATVILDCPPKYWVRRVRSQYSSRKEMEIQARLLFMGSPEKFTYNLAELYPNYENFYGKEIKEA